MKTEKQNRREEEKKFKLRDKFDEIKRSVRGYKKYVIAAMIPLVLGFPEMLNTLSPRINTQSQLESKLGEERRKLEEKIGDNTIIHAELSARKGMPSYAKKISDGEYEIVLSKEDANVALLRHELYHIADRHLGSGEKIRNPLTYLFWHEPQAVIYAAFGLKL